MSTDAVDIFVRQARNYCGFVETASKLSLAERLSPLADHPPLARVHGDVSTSRDRLLSVPLTLAAQTSRHLQLGVRDRRIIELALTKVRGTRVNFGDAMRALKEAAEEVIPSGRIFYLGSDDNGPIIGSLVSGVGIVEAEHGIKLVRVRADGDHAPLGWFSR